MLIYGNIVGGMVGALAARMAARQANASRGCTYENAMRYGTPTWCACEVCDRETPHMQLGGFAICVYARIEHPQFEYSHELAARYGRDAPAVLRDAPRPALESPATDEALPIAPKE